MPATDKVSAALHTWISLLGSHYKLRSTFDLPGSKWSSSTERCLNCKSLHWHSPLSPRVVPEQPENFTIFKQACFLTRFAQVRALFCFSAQLLNLKRLSPKVKQLFQAQAKPEQSPTPTYHPGSQAAPLTTAIPLLCKISSSCKPPT